MAEMVNNVSAEFPGAVTTAMNTTGTIYGSALVVTGVVSHWKRVHCLPQHSSFFMSNGDCNSFSESLFSKKMYWSVSMSIPWFGLYVYSQPSKDLFLSCLAS